MTVRVIQRDFHERKANFQPRPYFRLFVTWLVDFNAADPILDSSNFQVYAKKWIVHLVFEYRKTGLHAPDNLLSGL